MDTEWKVKVLPSAQADLDELDDDLRFEAMQVIQDLAEDPFPPGFIPMKGGYTDWYRVRCCSDRYRIVYRVIEKSRKILIERVRPRPTAYEGLLRP